MTGLQNSAVTLAYACRLSRLSLAAAMLLPVGCGYIGAPLTPLANVPTKISDLAAIQRGAALIVHCSVPTHTTENVLIKTPVKLDLRIGPAGDNFNAAEWSAHAKPVADPEVDLPDSHPGMDRQRGRHRRARRRLQREAIGMVQL
jgi:hypothetical protein